MRDQNPFPGSTWQAFGEWVEEKQSAIKPRLSDAELARRAGITRQHLGLIKHGQSGAKKPVVISIAMALGADPDEACDLAGFSRTRRDAPDVRFAREMEPILQKAGDKRAQVEKMLKRTAEDLISVLASSAA